MESFFIEALVEYAIAACFMLVRFFARWKIIGIRNFDLGDVFCLLGLVFYSAETSGQYLLSKYPANLYLTAETAPAVPKAEISVYVLGSKLAFINWIWYIHAIWSLKGVLLTLYYRMGAGIWKQQLVVLSVTGFIGASYLASILTHLCACTPVERAWQIQPYPGDECTVRPQNHWVIGILNVIGDLMILMIPMPLLFRVQIPLTRKLTLMFLFGTGLFIIITTILRTYYSLQDINTLPIAMGWASREMFVATIVVCLPGIKPLFTESRFFGSMGKSNNSGRDGGTGGSNGWMQRNGSARANATSDDGRPYYEMPKYRKDTADSDEEVMIGKTMPIQVKSDYTVTRSERQGE